MKFATKLNAASSAAIQTLRSAQKGQLAASKHTQFQTDHTKYKYLKHEIDMDQFHSDMVGAFQEN